MQSIYVKMGERIRSLRKDRKMSQAELGRAIGVAGSTIGGYESARHRIPMHQVQALENFLGKPIYLYQEKAPVPEPALEKLAPVLSQISNCKYLPITTSRRSRKNWQPMELHTKNMLPFPAELAEGIDYVYAGGTNENMNLYFISKDTAPRPGDLVITENPVMNEADHRCGVEYWIDSYDEIEAERQQLKDLGISNVACKEDKGRDTVVGVVKAAMQTGRRFGSLTNVMRLQI